MIVGKIRDIRLPTTLAAGKRGGLILVVLLLAISRAVAVEPGEMLSDPGLESRARAISAELRCLVCQNQTIDDSNAPLARDLRLIVRERLKAGDSDGEVKRFVVSRYGEFILLDPPLSAHTLVLWLTPLLLLGGAAVALWYAQKKTPVAAKAPVELTSEERLQLDSILRDKRACSDVERD